MAFQAPTAQPRSILRGHKAQVHATAFIRANGRLASGDADGYVVLWDLTIMRPRAVWQAHTNAILGIAPWGTERLITHGRDNRLVVWQIREQDETKLNTSLPLDASAPTRPQPWILHILEVNTMNFCSFAHCPPHGSVQDEELLVAVPNTLASESIRQETVRFMDKAEQNGMVMALAMFYAGAALTLVSGYENGLAIVAQKDELGVWHVLYKAQAHSQPILSLDVPPSRDYFITSGADSLVIKHPIPRMDGVLGVQENARTGTAQRTGQSSGTSLLSAALAGEQQRPAVHQTKIINVATQPMKTANTKHSGQQGVRIRSDGKIFATAGWDAKARIYSAQTMKELAVLKWHTVGCYTIAFASLDEGLAVAASDVALVGDDANGSDKASMVALPQTTELTVKGRRIQTAKKAHWVAVGSKDGKISLWDVY